MKAFLYLAFFLVVFLSFSSKGYANDIVINEIMANPKDGKLPSYEYVELFNNGHTVMDLSDITLQVNQQLIKLSNFLLAPQQFVILCSTDAEQILSTFGNALAVPKWPTLNNTGASIRIVRNGYLIDEVNYKENWHVNSTKRNGGWSLERINPNWLCNIGTNWSSSIASKGGTPGAPNSIYNRSAIPRIEVVNAALSENKIYLKFNIDKTQLPELKPSHFGLREETLKPLLLDWNINLDTIILTFDGVLENDKLYILDIYPLEMCGHHIVVPQFPIFKQSTLSFNAIVINEILFNPKEGGQDFVEIYNQNDLPVNLQNWRLGNRILSSTPLLLEPKQFFVFTADREKLSNHYPNTLTDRVIQLASLPAYPNQQGVVTLYSPTILMDSVYYNANMHSDWIKNPKGISLERKASEKESNLPGNFSSASTLEGGATPGYKNSTIVDNFSDKIFFQLSSPTFSPDGDFFEDELEINYNLNGANHMININIYNEKGILIKRLKRNESLGTAGKITWDGFDENGQDALAGHYILWAEIYNDKGHRKVYKSAFVLVRKSRLH